LWQIGRRCLKNNNVNIKRTLGRSFFVYKSCVESIRPARVGGGTDRSWDSHQCCDKIPPRRRRISSRSCSSLRPRTMLSPSSTNTTQKISVPSSTSCVTARPSRAVLMTLLASMFFVLMKSAKCAHVAGALGGAVKCMSPPWATARVDIPSRTG